MLNALAVIALLVGTVSATVSVNKTEQERMAAQQTQEPTVEIQKVTIEKAPIEPYGGF